MSTPRPTEGISIRAVPLAVFALILLVPFLNFEFTLYRSTLKLFVFQTATTLLWGYLLWEWAAGRLGREGWPAWWLFVPVGAWVAWGMATAAWSPQGWLAAGWVVQGFYGAAGALGLALLLRDAGHRRMFVAAGSVVAFALAFLMVLHYGDQRATFLGDIDPLSGREAGAAFLLLPTLIGAAALYQRTKGRDQSGYRGVVWLAVLLAMLLAAGVWTQTAAWRYAMGAGVALVAWLLLPRWRAVAAVLVLVVAVAAVQHETAQGRKVADYSAPFASVRRAVLDTADWRLLRGASPWRLLGGHGVGTFSLALDLDRPVWTYAATRGDAVVGHAGRQLTEELFERGVVGVALAIAAGVAFVVAGGLAFRRSRDGFDSAAGAGLAAYGVALGVFACFSSGAIGFGTGMMFWVALGLLGALSAGSGRPSALSWSPEEAAWRDEAGPRVRRGKSAAAAAAALGIVVAWALLAARPFWAEYCLREGIAEDRACRRDFAQKEVAEDAVVRHRAAVKRVLAELDAKLRSGQDALRSATADHGEAIKSGQDPAKAKALAEKKQAAATALDRLRAAAPRLKGELSVRGQQLEEAVDNARAKCEESARRTDAYLRRAARLSLGDRVWLIATIERARSEAACGAPAAALERLERFDAMCGPAFGFDVRRAACLARLGRAAEAHELYRRYARKNPFGADCALFEAELPFYKQWLVLLWEARRRKDPQADAWARDFIAAASDGLAWHPGHYGLLLLRGDMFFWLGDKARARDDMLAASAMIEDALGHITAPFVRASLYFELANANIRWDKEKALRAAERVFLEVDSRDPRCQPVIESAAKIKDHLEALKAKALKEKALKLPAPKAPAPPKAKADEPADAAQQP